MLNFYKIAKFATRDFRLCHFLTQTGQKKDFHLNLRKKLPAKRRLAQNR
jgi:hypothetical protein